MSDAKVCFNCGLRYPCETCGGTGDERIWCQSRQEYDVTKGGCPDCEHGWRKPEVRYCGSCPDGGLSGNCRLEPAPGGCLITGNNPENFCPECGRDHIPFDPPCPDCGKTLRGTGEVVTTAPGKYCFICECGLSGHVQSESMGQVRGGPLYVKAVNGPTFCHLKRRGEEVKGERG